MHPFRVSRRALRRIHYNNNHRPIHHQHNHHYHEFALLQPRLGAIRRRNFSSETTTRMSRDFSSSDHSSSHENKKKEQLEERRIEGFTSYALDSRRVPLGTIDQSLWDDMLAATQYHFHHQDGGGGGYSIYEADRLLCRLWQELAVANPNMVWYPSRRQNMLEMQRQLVHSWLDLVKRHNHSTLALTKADQNLIKLMQWEYDDDDCEDRLLEEHFPLDEISTILQGWLRLNTLEGSQNALSLLIKVTSHPFAANINNNHAGISNKLGPFFQKTWHQLQQTDTGFSESSLSSQLLDVMTYLKNNYSEWEHMEIPEISEEEEATEVLLPISQANEKQEVVKAMTPLELQVLEKKITEVLGKAEEADQNVLTKLLGRLDGTEPSENLVCSVVDYYANKREDAENATAWMRKLSIPQQCHVLDMVLQAWSKHDDGTRVPWRVEEIFRETLKQAKEHDIHESINVSSYNRVMTIWANSSDPIRTKKIRTWFTEMVQNNNILPDATSMKIVLRATLLDQNINTKVVEAVSARVVKEWMNFGSEDKEEMAEFVMQAASTPDLSSSPSLLKIAHMLKKEGFGMKEPPAEKWQEPPDASTFNTDQPQEAHEPSKTAIFDPTSFTEPNQILRKLEDLDQSTSGNFDLPVYVNAVRSMARFEKNGAEATKMLFEKAFATVRKNPQLLDAKQFAEFLTQVVGLLTSENMYGDADRCLANAERVFLSKKPQNNDSAIVPISIECYKPLIERNWYTKPVAARVKVTYERLMGFYYSGYNNLRPDRDIFRGHIRAQAMTADDPGKAEAVLDEMIKIYQDSGDEKCKPDADIFSAIMLAYKQQDEHNNDRHASEKSLELLDRMDRLGIPPNEKNLSLAMQSLAKSKKDDVYTSAMHLLQLSKACHLEQDSFFLHSFIECCGSAPVDQKEEALRNCLQIFGEFRAKKRINELTYGTLMRTVKRLVPTKGDKADKIASSMIELCCEDGLFDRFARKIFHQVMSDSVWKQKYTDVLLDGNLEPPEWRRNLAKRKHQAA